MAQRWFTTSPTTFPRVPPPRPQSWAWPPLSFPSSPPSSFITVDPFYRPFSVGNGRMLVTGSIAALQGNVHDLRWTVTPKVSTWPVSDFVPATPQITGKVDGDTFWFYAYGFEPSPHEALSLDTRWVADSGVFSVALASAPYAVARDGKRMKSVASLVLCQGSSDTWFYDAGADKLYANPTTGVQGLTYSMGDGAFKQLSEYTLWIDWRSTLSPTWTTLYTIDFTWANPVIDLRTTWDLDLNPDWISDSKVAKAIKWANARQIEDIYAWLDDIYQQSDTRSATWALPLWESLLKAPSGAALSIADRQTVITARRKIATGSREEFLAGLATIVGAFDIEDRWDELKIVMALQGSPDPVRRNIGEAYIAQAKPAGIETTLAYAGGFYADISEAGDPL